MSEVAKRAAARHRPAAPGASRGWNAAIGAAIVAWTFSLGCTPLRDFDIWWHLRTGQLILERGEVPQTDWYTYTSSERPWIDQHWGFQVAAARLYEAGGADALVLAKAAVAAIAVLIGWTASGRMLPLWLKTAVWVVGVTALAGRILERPDTVSVLGLAAWIGILGAADTRPRLLWLLPLVQVVWVNFHAVSVLGPIVGAMFVLDRLIRRAAKGAYGIEACRPVLGTVSAGCLGGLVLAAMLAGPYGLRGALFPIELFRKLSVDREFYARRIAEFQSPLESLSRTGLDSIHLPAAALLLGGTGLTFVVLYGRQRNSPFRIMLFVALTYLAMTQVRNLNLWALASSILACWNLGDLVGVPAEAARAGEGRSAALGGKLAALAAPLVLMACVIGGAWGQYVGGGWWSQFRLGVLEDNYYAEEALRFAGDPRLPRLAFLSPFSLASMYEFQHGPEAKVFMDPRLEVNTRATYEQWEEASKKMARGDPSWEAMVCGPHGERPVVVLDPRYLPSGIAGMLQNEGWRLVFADAAAAVFVAVADAERAGVPPADPRGQWWYRSLPRPRTERPRSPG